MRALLSGIPLVALLNAAVAQELRFQRISTEDGLSDNAITCVFEDRAGYIWIGTEHGLDRYDGQRVESCPPGKSGPLGWHISAIAEDATGRLWVSTTDGGLSMRDPRSGVFTHVRKKIGDGHGSLSDQLDHVLVVNDTLLVISSQDKGAFWFNTRRGTFTGAGYRTPTLNDASDTVAHAQDYWCHRAVRIDERRLWIPMLPADRSFVVDALSGTPIDTITLRGAAPFVPTQGLVAEGVLNIGGWSPGIHRIPIDGDGPPTFIPLDDEVTDLVTWGDGRLLVATKVNGLLLLDRDGTTIRRLHHLRAVESSLCNDRVRCLLKDRSGDLWVGTANGLSVFARNVWPFTTTPLLSDNDPGDMVFHNLQEDADGTLRLSTSMGFVLVDPSDLSTRTVGMAHKGLTLEATGLFRVDTGTYYLGTETGLFRYDPVRERILEDNEVKGPARVGNGSMFQVRSVFQEQLGDRTVLMVGVLGSGQVGYDANTGDPLRDWDDFKQRPGTLMLHNALKDPAGRFWSATLGGLVRWEAAAKGISLHTTYFNKGGTGEHRLPGDDASAIIMRYDTVQVGLRDAGLATIAGERAFAHIPPSYMPHDVGGVTMDIHGHVWCTTSDGLLRYDPRRASWLHIPVNDGRRFRQLSGCIITLRDGRIAFCADNHLITFDPGAFDTLPELPVPTLVEVRNTWGTLPTGEAALLDIPYRSSSFDAVITALLPTGVAPLTFLYRLEGIDVEAREIGAGEPIRYAGVPVGTHRLLVHVRDAYGREGPEHALLTVTVSGPFWQRWWFFLLVLAIGALGMYLISRSRTKQHQKLQRVRDRIARDLHDDIGSTLGSINYYSEALKRKLEHPDDGTAHDVAEKIGSSSRNMIDQMSDIVWSVDPKKDDAGSLIIRMEAFAADLLATKGIAFHFTADPGLSDRKLSADQRRNLFLIFKETLHNAVKYAACRSITVRVDHAAGSIVLEMRDDGSGFDPENVDGYNGNGLSNIKARAHAIGAQVVIESSPGHGTSMRVTAPVADFTRSGD